MAEEKTQEWVYPRPAWQPVPGEGVVDCKELPQKLPGRVRYFDLLGRLRDVPSVGGVQFKELNVLSRSDLLRTPSGEEIRYIRTALLARVHCGNPLVATVYIYRCSYANAGEWRCSMKYLTSIPRFMGAVKDDDGNAYYVAFDDEGRLIEDNWRGYGFLFTSLSALVRAARQLGFFFNVPPYWYHPLLSGIAPYLYYVKPTVHLAEVGRVSRYLGSIAPRQRLILN
jgi:hypothetical protein